MDQGTGMLAEARLVIGLSGLEGWGRGGLVETALGTRAKWTLYHPVGWQLLSSTAKQKCRPISAFLEDVLGLPFCF